MTRLILHIGDHKTGSTSIQMAMTDFYEKAPELRSSLLYCVAGRGLTTAHHNLAWDVRGDERFARKNGSWSEVAAEVEQYQPAEFVLSSEGFEHMRAARVAKKINETLGLLIGETRIVLYVRPHYDRIISNYIHHEKIGQSRGSLDQFIERTSTRRTFASSERIGNLLGAFGKDSVVVRPFTRKELIQGDVLADFSVHGLGRPADFLPGYAEEGQRNVSPSADVLAILQQYDRSIDADTGAYSPRLKRTLYKLLSDKMQPLYATGRKPGVSQDSVDIIKQAYADDAKWLDSFFGRPIYVDALANISPSEQTLDEQTMLGEREAAIHQAYRDIILELSQRRQKQAGAEKAGGRKKKQGQRKKRLLRDVTQ